MAENNLITFAQSTIDVPEPPDSERIQYDNAALKIPLRNLRLSPQYGRSLTDEIKNKPDEQMQELMASIHTRGFLQPLVVRPVQLRTHPETTHEVVAGWRRFVAAHHLGLSVVPCRGERRMSDVDAAAASITENLQRKNPNVVDIADALDNLRQQMQLEVDQWIERHGAPKLNGDAAASSQVLAKFENIPQWLAAVIERASQPHQSPRITREDLSRVVGKSPKTLDNYFDAGKLPQRVKDMISDGVINSRHVRVLTRLPQPEMQTKLARTIEREQLSSAQAEQLARQMKSSVPILSSRTAELTARANVPRQNEITPDIRPYATRESLPLGAPISHETERAVVFLTDQLSRATGSVKSARAAFADFATKLASTDPAEIESLLRELQKESDGLRADLKAAKDALRAGQ